MASSATTAFGTLLKLGDGGGTEAFATIAEVKNIKGPKLKMDTIEVTSHSSAGAWREFIAGLLDAGEVTFDMNWLPANATQSYSAGILRDMVNRTKRNFQLVIPAASPVTWTIPAFVTNFEPDFAVDGALVASITLKVAGQPTLA